MNNSIIRFSLLAFFLAALQILVFNEVSLNAFVQPVIYPLLILYLPYRMPHWLVMFIAFAYGFVIDVFSYTLAIHSAALVLMAFLRPYVLTLLNIRPKLSTIQYSVHLRNTPRAKFLLYFIIMLMLHQLTFHALVIFSIDQLFLILQRSLWNLLPSFLVMLLFELFVYGFYKGEQEAA